MDPTLTLAALDTISALVTVVANARREGREVTQEELDVASSRLGAKIDAVDQKIKEKWG
jgi:hypothetical protein